MREEHYSMNVLNRFASAALMILLFAVGVGLHKIKDRTAKTALVALPSARVVVNQESESKPKILVQLANIGQTPIYDDIKPDLIALELDVPAPEIPANPTSNSYVRFFRKQDSQLARIVVNVLVKKGISVQAQDFTSADYQGPGDLELWIGRLQRYLPPATNVYVIDLSEDDQLSPSSGSPNSALYEAYLLATSTPVVVRIYLKEKKYHTVVVILTQESARATLTTLQKQFPERWNGAEVRRLDEWCPVASPQPPASYDRFKFPVLRCT
jgi:hypothetical protein